MCTGEEYISSNTLPFAHIFKYYYTFEKFRPIWFSVIDIIIYVKLRMLDASLQYFIFLNNICDQISLIWSQKS
jgi:hypothetical protein